MATQTTLERLEQQITWLPVREQLRLIARISERLSIAPLDIEGEETLQQREKEANELLAFCDAAAEMWEGEFDAAQEIRQMRQKRDEQIWQSKL